MIPCPECARELPNAARNCPCGWSEDAPPMLLTPRQPPSAQSREHLLALRQRLFAAASVKPDRAWARRLLDRHKAGEPFSAKAIELALSVAGDAPAPYATSALDSADNPV